MNTLYFGDNLEMLRQHVDTESVDLIYLDPPFNSSRTYNLLFRQQKGDESPAQIMAFEDTWTWSPILYEQFMQDTANVKLFDLVESLYKILGKSEMMAYVLMMAPRLLELRRVLKQTGSMYLHCDPVASHYLKIILDVVFGPHRFRNEITWRRTDGHNDAKKQFGRVSDRLLLYMMSQNSYFQREYVGYQEKTLREWYKYLEFPDGSIRMMTKKELASQEIPAGARRFNPGDLRSPSPRKNLMYEYKGYKPHPNGWSVELEKMQKFDEAGLLLFPSSMDGRIMFKRYLAPEKGAVLGDVWTDKSMIRGSHNEMRPYPTQKPLGLLERIIEASSREDDTILDPFCGCGTAIVAADRMNRKWIGIDVTYLAIAEIEYRLSTETYAKRDKTYVVEGSPKDAYAAKQFFLATAAQNHKPFEMWAVSLVQGEPFEKKGRDKGQDGRIPIYDGKGKLQWAVIQVKGGKLSPTLIRDFGHVITREKAPFGLFICLEKPTKEMLQEAQELGVSGNYGARQVQRLQILTIEDLLEHEKQFDIPAGYVPLRPEGVGKAPYKTSSFEFDDLASDE